MIDSKELLQISHLNKTVFMNKIMLVFDIRSEVIKVAYLVKKFQLYADEFKTIVCVKGNLKMLSE